MSVSPSARRRRLIPYLLVAPFVVAFVVFVVAPILLALYNSLFVDRLIGGVSFVGVDNYVKAFTDDDFWSGFGRIVLYALVFVPLLVIVPLGLALVLDAKAVKARGLYRLVFFLPYAVPGVIATLMWGFLYGPSISPLNFVAEQLGLPGPNLLSDDAVLWSIVNIGLWSWAGYNMIIFYTGLQTIGHDVVEAARLDGASTWRIALSIKVPLVAPIVTMVVIFAIVGSLQLFTEPFVLQPLAPTSIPNDFTPNLYAYTLAGAGRQLNYVATLSFVLAALVGLVALVYLRISRKANRVDS